MQQYLIGLDNGGTVIKAALFDITGKELAVASRQTPLITPCPGYMERDMEELWSSNCACLREVLEGSEISPKEIAGVSVCGHGKGLYAWGKDDKPACNGIVSTDNRAWRYPEKWRAEGTHQRLSSKLCQELIPSQQASLLAWMKEHQPDVYGNIRWVFSVKDYIRFRLTGEAWFEATDASGSGLMNVREACFDSGLLEELGIGEVFEKLPPLCYSHEKRGSVTEVASALTGLRTGTLVAAGMFDIDACAIAMDITSPDQLCTITGTWSINECISPVPITGAGIAMNSLYAIPGYFLLEECSATSAGNLEWHLRNCLPSGELLGKELYEYANDLAQSVDSAECDVYYLPFLYGSNTHLLAKASLVGLTAYHTKAHLLRAVYEGVAFSHKTHIKRLLAIRAAPKAIRMAGGAVRSPFWVQLFADVLGYPIETVSGVSELGALGCAMAAAVAAGIYSDYRAAALAMVRVNLPIPPNFNQNAIYEEKFKKYTAVCHALDTVWDLFAV